MLHANPLVKAPLVALLALGGCQAPGTRDAQHGPASAARNERRRSVLRQVNSQFLERSRFPGAVLAAHFRDGTVVSSAVGVSDRETRRPMADDDRLLAGSSGKTFFAALALQLVDEGSLELDQPIRK